MVVIEHLWLVPVALGLAFGLCSAWQGYRTLRSGSARSTDLMWRICMGGAKQRLSGQALQEYEELLGSAEVTRRLGLASLIVGLIITAATANSLVQEVLLWLSARGGG